MTTISQAARDAAKGLQYPPEFHNSRTPERAIQDAIGAEKAAETASLRQQLEEKDRQLTLALKGKRPFSDKLAQEVINGQVKDIDRMQKCLADTRQQLEEAKAICASYVVGAETSLNMIKLVASERDTAIGRVAELEDQCAAMRDALEHRQHVWKETECEHDDCMSASYKADSALSSTAGASLLSRVKELEKDKAWTEWTNDNEPEQGERVLVLTRWGDVSIASRAWEQGLAPDHWKTQEGGRLELKDVTHWTGLPKSPQEALSAAMAKDQEQDAGGER